MYDPARGLFFAKEKRLGEEGEEHAGGKFCFGTGDD